MSEQNVDVVRRTYEAFDRGDIDALLSLCDENIEWITPGPPDLPTAGRRVGREAVRGFFGTLVETFEFQQFAAQTFIGQGEHVIVLGTDEVIVKATGTVVTEAWAHAFVVRDGKIVRFQEYLDMTAAVAELRGADARA